MVARHVVARQVVVRQVRHDRRADRRGRARRPGSNATATGADTEWQRDAQAAWDALRGGDTATSPRVGDRVEGFAVGDGDLIIVGVDFTKGEKAMSIAAIIYKSGLERGLYSDNFCQIYVALILFLG